MLLLLTKIKFRLAETFASAEPGGLTFEPEPYGAPETVGFGVSVHSIDHRSQPRRRGLDVVVHERDRISPGGLQPGVAGRVEPSAFGEHIPHGRALLHGLELAHHSCRPVC